MLKYGITTLRSGLVVAFVLIFSVIGLTPAESEEPSLDNVTSTPYVQDLAGEWHLELMGDDSVSRNGELFLYQAERVVFGSGYIETDNMIRNVVAGGSVEGDVLNLYLIAEEGDFILGLNFTVSYDDFISGDYRGYSADGGAISERGSGELIRDVPIEALFGFKLNTSKSASRQFLGGEIPGNTNASFFFKPKNNS